MIIDGIGVLSKVAAVGMTNSKFECSLNVQVLNGVRKEQLETAGVREGRSRGSRRPYTKQAPQTEQAVPDMGKKEKPVGPKKLSLRNVMTNPSSTISFVQVRIHIVSTP